MRSLRPFWQGANRAVLSALTPPWQALPCLSGDLWSPRVLLRDADGRCSLSNQWAGSLQMGPRWWHYLSSGMEPGEGCWERVGARLGQPSVPWRAWPRPEGWCPVDSELWPATGLAEVGTVALTLGLDVCRGQRSVACLGAVCTPSSLRGAEPGGRAMAAPGWVFTFEL